MLYAGGNQVRTRKCHTNIRVSMTARKTFQAPRYHCPVEAALAVIGGKWKVVILFWLQDKKRAGSASCGGKSRT